ncbi:IS110 family transposase [Deinococcus pimensis]|uniref:IS110 family transposase n=1 Tax=Deinococcus pimensis TaxID=309888 RepID=UPI000483A86B|nr:IS110 family transposase [Deinococcus pimensis]
MTDVFVGIDVSKRWLDVALRPSLETWRVTNSPEDVAALAGHLVTLTPVLVVLEATGGHERDLVAALSAQALPVVVAHGWHVRQFARATGRLAKTDRVDALVLAQFAERIRPEVRELPDAFVEELRALVVRRLQVQGLRLAEGKRLLMTRHEVVRASLTGSVAHLKLLEGTLDKEIMACVGHNEAAVVRFGLLTSAPGVGPTLAVTLLALLPELGRVSHRQVAALVGVAPVNVESGTKISRWRIHGGRGKVRHVLFMATMTAVRCNPVLHDAYVRLKGRGKPQRVAMVACMRRLLVMLNAMARDGKPWRERKEAPA